MSTHAQKESKKVATNLYQYGSSGNYYALFKAGGKQIRKSLRTKDREIARRKLEDLVPRVQWLRTGEGRSLLFAEWNEKGELVGGLAKQWFDIVAISVEPSTRDRYLLSIRDLAPHFKKGSVRNIAVEQQSPSTSSRATPSLRQCRLNSR